MLSPTIRIVYCDDCDLAVVVPTDGHDPAAMLMAQHLAGSNTHLPHLSDVYAIKITHKRKPRK